MKLEGRLDHDPDIAESVLKRLILARLKTLELRLQGVGFMVVDDPVFAGKKQNDDGSTRWARGGARGQSDVRLVVLGDAWGIEVKTSTGKQSKRQRTYQKRLEAAGGRYVLARNLRQALEPVCAALGVELVA